MRASREQRAASCGLFLLAACCLPLANAATPEENAKAAWSRRDQPGQTEAAILLWKRAAKLEPNRGDLWAALAAAQGRAVRHAPSPEDARKWAEDAVISANKAIRVSTPTAAAFTAFGEAMGQFANTHKGIQSLSLVKKAVEALNRAILLDPKDARAHMLLSAFYRQSPSVLSVGDKAKALEEAKLAVEYGPGYAINHLTLARALLDNGKKAEGIAELQKAVALTSPADAIPETRADQETARRLLKSLGASEATSVSSSSTTVPCGDPATGACTEKKP